jgi:hypothetical protein
MWNNSGAGGSGAGGKGVVIISISNYSLLRNI